MLSLSTPAPAHRYSCGSGYVMLRRVLDITHVHWTLAVTPPVLCPREPRPGGDSPNTKHTLEHGVQHIFKDKRPVTMETRCLIRWFSPFFSAAKALFGALSSAWHSEDPSVHYTLRMGLVRRRWCLYWPPKVAGTGSIFRGCESEPKKPSPRHENWKRNTF